MNKKTVMIAAVAIVGVCLCCVVVGAGITLVGGRSILGALQPVANVGDKDAAINLLGGVGMLGATQPVADAGDKFMQSLRDGNYAAAHALMHPDLQQEIGTPQDLRQMIESNKAQPKKWTFTSRDIENDEGYLEGSVTMTGGEGTVTIDLVKVGNDWKVVSFNLEED